MPRPNILFLLTDRQRADALGAVSPWLQTPALDRLAREGVVFRRCVTQSPGCIPARVSRMTGLYRHNTSVWHGRGFTLPTTARTWVRAVRDWGLESKLAFNQGSECYFCTDLETDPDEACDLAVTGGAREPEAAARGRALSFLGTQLFREWYAA